MKIENLIKKIDKEINMRLDLINEKRIQIWRLQDEIEKISNLIDITENQVLELINKKNRIEKEIQEKTF